MRIIDAHHHIWWREHTPWLQGEIVPRIFGDYGAIQRDYGIDEFRREAEAEGVVGSVYVQVNVAAGDEVGEVERVTKAGAPFIGAVTAFADFARPDVGDLLDREIEAGPVRGIRQQLHWHRRTDYRFAARPDLMSDPVWRRGFAELERRGLVFELQVFPSQYAVAIDLVDSFPNVTFVLLHAGMPEDASEEARADWAAGLARFAERPNVWVKLSGLGTFERRCDLAAWRPIVERTVDVFGPGRCMFGSNFPVEKLWTTYATLVATMKTCLERLAEDERRMIFHDVASRIYRLAPPSTKE